MSKGFECFNNILCEGDFRYFSCLYSRDEFDNDVTIVKNELRTLNIILTKQVSIPTLIRSLSYRHYNEWINWQGYDLIRNLTKDEYDLLKEVINHE